jgi:hypothetical protein
MKPIPYRHRAQLRDMAERLRSGQAVKAGIHRPLWRALESALELDSEARRLTRDNPLALQKLAIAGGGR